jgi:hypothetical protein
MRKSDPILQNDQAFAGQMQTFKSEIGNYATTLSLSADIIKGQAADADYFDYCVKCQHIMLSCGQQWTVWKDLTRDGGTPPPTGVPAMPTLPVAVPPVSPGVEARFRDLIQQIKLNPNYNVAMGQALGIEGAQETPPDMTSVQPPLTLTFKGNHVQVNSGWQGYSAYFDQIQHQVDRGDGKGLGLLAVTTSVHYIDPTPIPTTPARWTYRSVYLVNDVQVGQWSNPVSITVGA